MREQPRVTWLLPVKNSLRYLAETLASVAAQTYENHQVFARDDGSTDGSLEELSRWIPSRIPGRIFSGPSLGVGQSLAFLVEQAETELCARIDADDVNLPQRLARQVQYMSEHPEVGVLGSQIRIIDENGADQGNWVYETEDADVRWLTRWHARVCHPATLLRRSLVLRAGNYRDMYAEDFDLWMRISFLTEIRNVSDTLLKYRRTTSSKTGMLQNLEDFVPTAREVARANVAILFPGIENPQYAMELWEVAHPAHASLPVKFRHVRNMELAAVEFARRVAKPDSYFQNSSAFKEQHYHLRRRFFEGVGLKPLLNARDRFRRAKRNRI